MAKHRYKQVEGRRLIEVRVRNSQQLFDVRDPAPFRERDLDDDFVEYIVSSAKECSVSSPIKIVIYIEDQESADLKRAEIKEAIHSYFAYQVELQTRDLKRFVKRAQFFLFIGMLILFSCIWLAQSLDVPGLPALAGILREGIVIFGWVSLWKPIELILFDWYPLYEKLRFYRKILATEIELHFKAR